MRRTIGGQNGRTSKNAAALIVLIFQRRSCTAVALGFGPAYFPAACLCVPTVPVRFQLAAFSRESYHPLGGGFHPAYAVRSLRGRAHAARVPVLPL